MYNLYEFDYLPNRNEHQSNFVCIFYSPSIWFQKDIIIHHDLQVGLWDLFKANHQKMAIDQNEIKKMSS